MISGGRFRKTFSTGAGVVGPQGSAGIGNLPQPLHTAAPVWAPQVKTAPVLVRLPRQELPINGPLGQESVASNAVVSDQRTRFAGIAGETGIPGKDLKEIYDELISERHPTRIGKSEERKDSDRALIRILLQEGSREQLAFRAVLINKGKPGAGVTAVKRFAKACEPHPVMGASIKMFLKACGVTVGDSTIDRGMDRANSEGRSGPQRPENRTRKQTRLVPYKSALGRGKTIPPDPPRSAQVAESRSEFDSVFENTDLPSEFLYFSMVAAGEVQPPIEPPPESPLQPPYAADGWEFPNSLAGGDKPEIQFGGSPNRTASPEAAVGDWVPPTSPLAICAWLDEQRYGA